MRMNKVVVAAFSGVVAAISLSGQAQAISRYNSTALSCGKIHGILDSEGAAILRYPSKRNASVTLYDRYVRSEMQCGSHEILEPVTIPSASGQCQVLHCIRAPDNCDEIADPLCH